jgi:hypothetical protein
MGILLSEATNTVTLTTNSLMCSVEQAYRIYKTFRIVVVLMLIILLISLLIEFLSLRNSKDTIRKQIKAQTLLSNTESYLNKNIIIAMIATVLLVAYDIAAIFSLMAITYSAIVPVLLVVGVIIPIALIVVYLYLFKKRYTDKQILSKVNGLAPDTIELMINTVRRTSRTCVITDCLIVALDFVWLMLSI